MRHWRTTTIREQQRTNIITEIARAYNTMEEDVNVMTEEFEQHIEPIRRSVFERFPILFLLLVTFGLVSVLYGFERLYAFPRHSMIDHTSSLQSVLPHWC